MLKSLTAFFSVLILMAGMNLPAETGKTGADLSAESNKTDEREPAPGRFEITYENGLLSVKANEVNVETLLKEFARKAQVTFNKYTGTTQTISLNLNEVPVEQFLDRVLDNYVAKSKKKNGITIISAVTILDSSPQGPAPPPPPSREQEREEKDPARPQQDEPADDGAATKRKRRPSSRFPRHRKRLLEKLPPEIREEIEQREQAGESPEY
jgi:hypothetical protein